MTRRPILFLVLTLAALQACATAEGLGEDMQIAGAAIEDAANNSGDGSY